MAIRGSGVIFSVQHLSLWYTSHQGHTLLALPSIRITTHFLFSGLPIWHEATFFLNPTVKGFYNGPFDWYIDFSGSTSLG